MFSGVDAGGVRLLRCTPLEATYADGGSAHGGDGGGGSGPNATNDLRARATRPGHRDAILSMCAVEGGGGSTLLATGSRDGVVKCWV